MTKAYSRFLAAFFCLFLGGLLVWHVLLPDRARSETENRTLAQRPELTWSALADGSFTKAVEDYFADQFPLRDGWTGVKARAELLLGKREFNNVYLCGDTLIAKVNPPLDGLEERNLNCVRRMAERTEIPVYLGLIPSAAEVWREKLPAGAESWDQAAFISRAAELEGVEPVDVLGALRARAEELGCPFLEISAASHQGTRQLVGKIAEMLASLPPVTVYEPEYVPRPPEVDTSAPLDIRQEDGVWFLEGSWLQRLMGNVNFADYESRMWFDKTLREAGVFRQMEEMGIRDGDTVSLYGFEFEYQR